MKSIHKYLPNTESWGGLMGTLLCRCHYPIPVSVSYEVMPDFSKLVRGELTYASGDSTDAGAIELLARSKHVDGLLILATQQGAWLIEPTRIVPNELVEFKSVSRVELEIGCQPVADPKLELRDDTVAIERGEYYTELISKNRNAKAEPEVQGQES